MPAPPPIQTRRRPGQPDGVAVADAERREDAGKRVRCQSDVEILQPAAAQVDAAHDERGTDDTPSGRPGNVATRCTHHSSSIGTSDYEFVHLVTWSSGHFLTRQITGHLMTRQTT